MFDPDHSLRVVEGAELGSLTHCDLDSVDLSVFGDSRAADAGDDFGNPALYRAWYERNPEIYSFLLSGATLVGYGNAMPLIDSAFAQVLDGTISDGHIEPSMIRRYDEPGDYKLYLCSLAVVPTFRTKVAGVWTMYGAFQRKIEALRARGIRITEIASIVWSKEGRLICYGFGMSYHGPHVRRGDVYHGTLVDGRFPNQLADR